MKTKIKTFAAGFLTAILLFVTVSAAPVQETIDVIFNSINITVDGQKVEVDNIMYNGTTYAPLRAVAEMLGKEVAWNGETNTAAIQDPISQEATVCTPNQQLQAPQEPQSQNIVDYTYIGSKNSDKYHKKNCRWVEKIEEENAVYFNSKEEAVQAGYKPCGTCKP